MLRQRGGRALRVGAPAWTSTPGSAALTTTLDRPAPPTSGPGSPLAGYLARSHDRHRAEMDGAVATYIPELGVADRAWFGIAAATLGGVVPRVGDAERPFTIQSISKPLVYALILDRFGEAAVRARIGVEPTGDAFNAITLAPGSGLPLNPMVNAGAIAAAAMLGAHGDGRRHTLDGIGRFVGRRLGIDASVLDSERATGHRNRAIGHLLRSSGAIEGDATAAVEDYFVQCSILVTAADLAVIAATLANGGVNPITGVRAASEATVRTVLSVMATCGMYDGAGDWLVNVGLPAKSGVSGGILAVVPGQLGIGTYAPPLDPQGNSVRGTRVCRDLVHDLRLHPMLGVGAPPTPIRATYTLAEVGSRRRRPAEERARLSTVGREVRVIELQGTLGFLAADAIADRLHELEADGVPATLIVDLRRVDRIEPSAVGLLAELCSTLAAEAGTVIQFTRAAAHQAAVAGILERAGRTVEASSPTATLDAVMEAAEDHLLGSPTADGTPGAVPLERQAIAHGLSPTELATLSAVLRRRA
jgi:glutaminase